MVKKLISILLITTMMLYSVGFYVAYRYNISAIKTEMRSAIAKQQYPAQQLYTIDIPLKNNLPTAKDFGLVDDKEMSFEGEMYDIVQTHYELDKVTYTCISDREETNLILAFAKEVQHQTDHPTAGKKAVSLIKFSCSVFTVSEPINIPYCQQAIANNQPIYNLDKLSKAYQNIPSPPPWQS